MKAVILAGGLGTRIKPFTQVIPKPLLPIGEKAVLEIQIEQLARHGFTKVCLATNYKSEYIENFFGDGSKYGIEFKISKEDQPLGTAGPISLLRDELTDPFLVMNGDILTQVDFRAMLDFHHEHAADMTIAVRQYDIDVPYGVIETEGVRVVRIVEKPTIQIFINSGMYLINPDVHQFISPSQRLDMPELISRLIQEGYMVICFPVREYWLDIGKLEDYRQAMADADNGVLAELQQLGA